MTAGNTLIFSAIDELVPSFLKPEWTVYSFPVRHVMPTNTCAQSKSFDNFDHCDLFADTFATLGS